MQISKILLIIFLFSFYSFANMTSLLLAQNTNSQTNTKNNDLVITKQKQKIIFDAIVIEKLYMKTFIDGQEQKGIMYYPKDTIHLEANSTIRIKIGNAGGIIATINDRDIKLGKHGEIGNKIIMWTNAPHDETSYILIIDDWKK